MSDSFAWWLPRHWSFTRRISHDLLIGVAIGVSIVSLPAVATSLALYFRKRREPPEVAEFAPRPIELRSDETVNGIIGLIGNTPLIRINSLSDALGVEILASNLIEFFPLRLLTGAPQGKAEFLNPGGSVKDRVALRIIEDAEHQGLLTPGSGSTIFEGTVGSTGISIATVARARGYETSIIMPDDVADEKARALQALGARVEKVRPASIVDQKQFVNLARQRALAFGQSTISSDDEEVTVATSDPNRPRGFFADQFENRSNFDAHYEGTGPEIWRQTNGSVDAFVSGAGTGGTISGTGTFLKSVNPEVKVILADPEGSGLFNKIKWGVMFDRKEKEGTRRRHQVDTIVEGIGINRLTKNFELGLPIIDDAFRITDAEAIAISRHVLRVDGLFIGSSTACNLVASIRLAKSRKLGFGKGSGRRIVTLLCDSGSRGVSKFWNDEYLRKANIPIDLSIVDKLLDEDEDDVPSQAKGEQQ